MTTPINLNHARKAKAKAEKAKRAEENRVKHGRTKAERQLEVTRRDNAKRKIDAHKRSPE